MIYLNNKLVEIKKFPNGETFINTQELNIKEQNIIKLKFQGDEDIMHLVFLKKYLDENNQSASLKIGYIPYSRMDRTEGIALFTLKYFCQVINSLNFNIVDVYEPHSDVSVALIDRVRVVNKSAEMARNMIRELSKKQEKLFVVYPDAGAQKRYSKQIKYDNILTANKERDFKTGNIKSLEITGKYAGGSFNAIIVDDLCSRGGTFMLTAKKLKEMGAKDIYLVVTHCEDTIFEGDILKTDLIKNVFTTDSILTKKHEKLVVVKIN